MNAYTNTAADSRNVETQGVFSRWFRTFRAELRRAIELAGEPYTHGIMPPL